MIEITVSLRGRGETLGAVVEAGDKIESAEGHGIRDYGSGKGATATGIRQARWEQGRVGRGEYIQRRIGESKGTLVCLDGDR